MITYWGVRPQSMGVEGGRKESNIQKKLDSDYSDNKTRLTDVDVHQKMENCSRVGG